MTETQRFIVHSKCIMHVLDMTYTPCAIRSRCVDDYAPPCASGIMTAIGTKSSGSVGFKFDIRLKEWWKLSSSEQSTRKYVFTFKDNNDNMNNMRVRFLAKIHGSDITVNILADPRVIKCLNNDLYKHRFDMFERFVNIACKHMVYILYGK